MQVASKELHMWTTQHVLHTARSHTRYPYLYIQYKVKSKNVTAARVEKSKHNPTSLRIWILVCRDSVSPVFSLSLRIAQALLEMDEGFFLPLKIQLWRECWRMLCSNCGTFNACARQANTDCSYGVLLTILFLKYFCKLYWKDFGVGRGVHFGEQLNWKKTTFVSM